MSLNTFPVLRAVAVLLALALPVAAAPAEKRSSFVRALDAMMVALSPESARAGRTIRRVYREHLDLLMLNGYPELEGALDNSGLVPLPSEPLRFNLVPRLDGPHPIGEKDLDHQASYISARPATIGALIDIASRVKSGPLEITSLVRHSHYQDALRSTNRNANTSVPMHTMGLAFDIALVNTPLETVYEIRDVLRKMQRDGDILFIGERRQLVFHVVPHPARLGHFTELYIRKVGLPPTSRFAEVVAFSPAPAVRRTRTKPKVTTEVVSFLHAERPWEPWHVPALESAPVSPPAAASAVPVAAAFDSATASAKPIIRRWFILLAALMAATWRIAARPRVRPSVFELRS
jgi:hypothetical protein